MTSELAVSLISNGVLVVGNIVQGVFLGRSKHLSSVVDALKEENAILRRRVDDLKNSLAEAQATHAHAKKEVADRLQEEAAEFSARMDRGFRVHGEVHALHQALSTVVTRKYEEALDEGVSIMLFVSAKILGISQEELVARLQASPNPEAFLDEPTVESLLVLARGMRNVASAGMAAVHQTSRLREHIIMAGQIEPELSIRAALRDFLEGPDGDFPAPKGNVRFRVTVADVDRHLDDASAE
ncbi:MAG: hypothetical protein KC766_09795 [Myxococcales bacterium]|nr:hypothetical protein [Myxococcales bacterium]